MKVWLLDTGPIVARLNESDPDHPAVTAALDPFNGQFVTTGAVITEVMHFAAGFTDGPASLVHFLELSGTQVIECCQPKDLLPAAELMEKYSDSPMDFADATLICLSDMLRQYSIVTLDRRGFTIFRSPKGKSFRLVLDSPN